MASDRAVSLGEIVGEGRVLEARLLAPVPRPGWVDRPGLIEELEPGAATRLTLVSAPAGAGKSTLLAQWAAAHGRGVAWLTLDASDNTPAVFWTYVIAALRTVAPAFGETLLRRLRAPGVVVEDEVLPLLVNALAELAPVTLVLDDSHAITDGDVYAGLHYVVERLPPGVRIVLATQAEPPFPLGRLRARGELSELRDLRFSSDQSAVLLRTALGVEVDPAAAGRVNAWAEGWAAGLQLAALSARGQDDPLRYLGELPSDERHVVDYLWDDVLDRQPPDVRRFLVETSILRRFSAPLCAAVSRRPDAQQVVFELERTNVFLVTLDASRRWYRYHGLFRGVLARELESRDPLDVADLHRRASEWYAREGLHLEAIEHALLAGDEHYAADELVRHWLPLYSEGHGYTILGWLDRLPDEAIAANPSLSLLTAGLAWSLGQREETARWLAAFEANESELGALPGDSSVPAAAGTIVRSMILLTDGDIDGALEHARRAEALELEAHGLGTVLAAYFHGVVLYYAADPSAAEPRLAGFLADARTADHHARASTALAYLAYIALDAGDVTRARDLAGEALDRALAHGLDEYGQTSLPQGALGGALLADGELDRAEEHLERAVALATRSRSGSDVALALLQLGRLRVRQDDLDAARDALAAARAALDGARLPRLAGLERELAQALGDGRPGLAELSGQELSEAELRVLRQLPEDLTYRQIAERLFVSLNTVKTHTYRIRRKLGVASRSECVAAARRRELI